MESDVPELHAILIINGHVLIAAHVSCPEVGTCLLPALVLSGNGMGVLWETAHLQTSLLQQALTRSPLNSPWEV